MKPRLSRPMGAAKFDLTADLGARAAVVRRAAVVASNAGADVLLTCRRNRTILPRCIPESNRVPRSGRELRDQREVQVRNRQCVLIVGRSLELREVLRAVFEPRGLRVLEAAAVDDGLALVRLHAPDVVVLDADAGPASAEDVFCSFTSQTARKPARLVVLGGPTRSLTARPTIAGNGCAPSPAGFPRPCDYLAKPYHYAPLILRIEALLANSRTSASAA